MTDPGKKIKVLRLITRLNVGGPAQHVVWLGGRLDRRRFESLLVTGVVGDNEASMDYLAEKERAELLRIPELKRKIGLHDILAAFKIYRIISDFEPDIIHTHTSKAGFLGGLAGMFYNIGRFLGKKSPVIIVHTFHGHTFNGYFSHVRERIFQYVERFLSTFSLGRHVILVLSAGQREEIIRYLRLGKSSVNNRLPAIGRRNGWPTVPTGSHHDIGRRLYRYLLQRSDAEVKILPLGIDLKPFSRIDCLRGRFRAEYDIPGDTLVVGWVGRLTPIKNPDLFLDMACVCKKICSVCFVMIGEGELREYLQKKAKTLKIADSVLFTGNLRDMLCFWADADILVLTSDNEGTPVSILEAMASGVPVVATDVGGVGEITCRDWTPDWQTVTSEHPRGVLVKPQNIEELAAVLKELMEDPSRRRSLGQSGPLYVKKNHSLKRLISDMETLYLQITNSRRRNHLEGYYQ